MNPEPGEIVEDEGKAEGDNTEAVEGEYVVGEHGEHEELEGEHVEGEEMEGEHVKGEHVEGEHVEGEHVEGEHVEGKDKEKLLGEGEELMGEEMEGEFDGEQTEERTEEAKVEEVIEEEEQVVEEPPPDPSAPFNFSDSKEEMKPKWELRPDQQAEVEELWEYYQNYTPAYTDINGYITEKELIYMLKALLIMTYTPEQLDELVAFCVRPPHPLGHINYEQFLKMVTMRQRDFPIEDELRCALEVFDPERTGEVDRENLKEVLGKQGHKMPQKLLDNLIKEVDMSNDGTLGIDDIVGTMCIDLNPEDLIMLRNAVFPPDEPPPPPEEF